MLGKRIHKSLIGWDPISPRILRASFSTNNKRVKTNIVVIYAQTNETEEEGKLEFYSELQEILETLPEKADINIVI